MGRPPQLRAAVPADIPSLCRMLDGLVQEDGLDDAGPASPEAVERGLFGPYHFAEALVWEGPTGPLACALFFQVPGGFFHRPSSLFLEHLWVERAARRQGIARALMTELGRIAEERQLAQVEWSALSTNEGAHAFYRGLGAQPMRALVLYRLVLKR